MEERVGAALLPLTSCFHPLESVVFQNRGTDSQKDTADLFFGFFFPNLSTVLKHAGVICQERREEGDIKKTSITANSDY